MTETNFIEKCVQGQAMVFDIDEYLDEWHNVESDKTIYDFLGMTDDEYSWWIHDSNALQLIVMKHQIDNIISIVEGKVNG